MNLFRRIFGEDKKTRLIRALVTQRFESYGIETEFRFELEKIGKLELLGTAEGTIVSIVETFVQSKKGGADDLDIIEHIERHRSQIGTDAEEYAKVFDDRKMNFLEKYCIYRVRIECGVGPPILEDHIRSAILQALDIFVGAGIKQNLVGAVKRISKAAEQGGADAAPVSTSFSAWTRKAAEQGDADAQVALGVLYADGDGVPQDYAEAVKWFRKAADKGDDDAQHCLGIMFHDGLGVTQNLAESAKWFRRAAEQNQYDAQHKLGLMYALGEGVAQDYAEAVKWYRKAADQSNAGAQRNLGLMCAQGKGMVQDDAEAARWFRRAADQGNAEAQSDLAAMYKNGRGVPQDYSQAHKWLTLAAAGFPASEAERRDKAIKNRESIASHMTPAQVAEAQRLAREWKPKPEK
jgi:uncharacterized protein